MKNLTTNLVKTKPCDDCMQVDLVGKNISGIHENDLYSQTLVHNDHLRIVYFDVGGKYLGDMIVHGDN